MRNLRIYEFSELITDLHDGATNAELTRRFRHLLAAVTTTGKPGTLTYQIKIEPDERADGEPISRILVSDTIKTSEPDKGRGKQDLWADSRGGLYASDPNQPSLFDTVSISVPTEAGDTDTPIADVLADTPDENEAA